MHTSVIGQIRRPTSDRKQARTSEPPRPRQGRPDPGQQRDSETHTPHLSGGHHVQKRPNASGPGLSASEARPTLSGKCPHLSLGW